MQHFLIFAGDVWFFMVFSYYKEFKKVCFELLRTFSFLVHYNSCHINIKYVLKTQLMLLRSFNFFTCFFLSLLSLNTTLMCSHFKAFSIHKFVFFQFRQSFNVDWMAKAIFSSRSLLFAQKMNDFPMIFFSMMKHWGKVRYFSIFCLIQRDFKMVRWLHYCWFIQLWFNYLNVMLDSFYKFKIKFFCSTKLFTISHVLFLKIYYLLTNLNFWILSDFCSHPKTSLIFYSATGGLHWRTDNKCLLS